MATKNNPKRSNYFAAVVLGTALAAVGQNGAASAETISGQAIASISRYCTACWRNARLPVDRWGDCTQEVLRRLLERLDPQAWDDVLARDGEERKEFIRAIDAVKKRTQRDRCRTTCLGDDLSGAKNDRDQWEEKDAVRQAASRLLSPRQQRILRMTVQGWSVADIAHKLSTTSERVSDEKYKAIQKLRAHFRDDWDA